MNTRKEFEPFLQNRRRDFNEPYGWCFKCSDQN